MIELLINFISFIGFAKTEMVVFRIISVIAHYHLNLFKFFILIDKNYTICMKWACISASIV
jgi:hypothetical protein